LYVLDYLADPGCASRPQDLLCVEYRLLCSGAIYRRTPGEWYKSEGARFLLEPPLMLYAVSRPFEEYPLELALRLKVPCVEETQPTRSGGGQVMNSLHPDEDVARDFAALLSVLSRRLITISGATAARYTYAPYEYPEFNHMPLPLVTSMRKVYWPSLPATVAISFGGKQEVIHNNPLPKAVDPDRLTTLLLALPRIEHAESIVGSARLYALALELIREKPDIAYQLLISAVETIANKVLERFQPQDDAKVEQQRAVFKLALEFGLGEEAARKLALEACKREHWAKRKFREFLTTNTDDTIWDNKDGLYGPALPLELPRREDFQQTVGRIYDARSEATHWGRQFPISGSYAGGSTIPVQLAIEWLSRASDFPPIAWFERVVNTAIRTFWERSISALGGAAVAEGAQS
jgi:hypothetical protein